MDDPGPPAGVDARDALERLLLDGPRRYTRVQVAELSGMPLERTRRLWRSLGFADSTDDDPAYSDADIAALGALQSLIDSGFVGPETAATIARAMGQALSRLADWQTDMLADLLAGAARGGRLPPRQARGVAGRRGAGGGAGADAGRGGGRRPCPAAAAARHPEL